ncbi:MAG: hypothetical protein H6728_01630 [Myxococcales bacterium]|nr:hypothetical protein [Myxococcales bacterium]
MSFVPKVSAGNACASDETECNGVCIRTQVDPQNCGACGTTCATGEVCSQRCLRFGACASGETDCGGACVTLKRTLQTAEPAERSVRVGKSAAAVLACVPVEPPNATALAWTCRQT